MHLRFFLSILIFFYKDDKRIITQSGGIMVGLLKFRHHHVKKVVIKTWCGWCQVVARGCEVNLLSCGAPRSVWVCMDAGEL